jgi:hypothetical protein
LADALFNYNRSADAGIAYRIHQLLYEYAKLRGDTDAIVRELYFQGITLLYLNVRDAGTGVNLFHRQIGAYFRGRLFCAVRGAEKRRNARLYSALPRQPKIRLAPGAALARSLCRQQPVGGLSVNLLPNNGGSYNAPLPGDGSRFAVG